MTSTDLPVLSDSQIETVNRHWSRITSLIDVIANRSGIEAGIRFQFVSAVMVALANRIAGTDVSDIGAMMPLVRESAESQAGDSAVLAQLGNAKAFALGFASFLADLVAAGVATMENIITTEPEPDISELLRVLPSDHPLTVKIREARKAVLANQPTEWNLHEAGEILIGKDPSKCAMVVAVAIIDGKKTKIMFGLKKWLWLVSLPAADLAKIRNLLSIAETKGWK